MATGLIEWLLESDEPWTRYRTLVDLLDRHADDGDVQAARAAMSEAFGREATFIRCGASIPVTELFQRLLGLDAAMMGFGLPDDAVHSPNEKFALSHLHGGAAAAAAFMAELADRIGQAK